MNARSTKTQKCCFCEKPIDGESFPGFCKKLKPRVACRQCTHNYIVARDSFGKWTPTNSVIPAIDVNTLSQTAQQNSLFANDGYSTIRVGDREWRVSSAGPGYRARLRLKDNLEQCACTHKATRHVDDGQGNLLHCRDCDCDRFWYAVPQTRNSDLLVLAEASVSAEPSVLDKLAAMANDPRTNASERIAATRRISALLQKEAA
jgi:hypothetical protein